jgi:hypothetical protein
LELSVGRAARPNAGRVVCGQQFSPQQRRKR